MTEPLRIGIAGLGTVGASVVKIIQDNEALLSNKCSRKVIVTAVSARDKNKDRGVDLSDVKWVENPVEIANDPDVDVVVELIGGSEGPAYELISQALINGKPIVTANKALVAEQSYNLLSNKSGQIAYEAAVAGGIPIIKGLREGLAANNIKAVYGILNGTCNYILSTMSNTGRDFEDVLKEAQDLGYAEADPGFDVDGVDAAHKLAILSALAYGCWPDFDAISIDGIRNVSALDIQFASELGYVIKLLGITRYTNNGIEQSVEPCMVPKDAQMAAVNGAFNAVYVDGDFVGETLFVGRGAGGGPTASAVVADIVDVARGQVLPVFGVESASLEPLRPASLDSREGLYYLRLMVVDQPGVVADITAVLRDFNVSMESLLQHGRSPGQPVPLIMTTHHAREEDIKGVVDRISELNSVVEEPHLIRIENFN